MIMKQSLFKKNADFIFGIVVIVLSVTCFIVADMTITDSGSAMMPKLILGFMAAMGLGISVSSIIRRMKDLEDMTKVSGADIAGGILFPAVFLLAAYFLINFLGFYAAEFLLIVSLMYLQEKVTNGKIEFNPKRLAGILVFAICAIIVMYLIFNLIFNLPTPKGIFGF